MKMGWEHWPSVGGHVVLRHAPAAAFIEELTRVEEFAVLAIRNGADDISAIFSVRGLQDALDDEGVGWRCQPS